MVLRAVAGSDLVFGPSTVVMYESRVYRMLDVVQFVSVSLWTAGLVGEVGWCNATKRLLLLPRLHGPR